MLLCANRLTALGRQNCAEKEIRLYGLEADHSWVRHLGDGWAVGVRLGTAGR